MFETQCKLCGETLIILEDEHLLADYNIHIECQMDIEEYEYPSPVDLF